MLPHTTDLAPNGSVTPESCTKAEQDAVHWKELGGCLVERSISMELNEQKIDIFGTTTVVLLM